MPGLTVVPDASGKVTLTHVETGEVCTRWPVDAREMLATGAWRTVELAAPQPVSADPSADALPGEEAPGANVPIVLTVVPPLPEDLAQRTKAEIGLYASLELGLALDAGSLNKEQMLQAVRDAHAAKVAASGGTLEVASSGTDAPPPAAPET